MMQIGSTHWEGELHSLWIFDGLCSMPSQHHCRIPKSSTSLLKCAIFQLQVEGTAAKFPGRPSSWDSQSTSSNAEGLSKLDVTSCLKLLWQEKLCQGDPAEGNLNLRNLLGSASRTSSRIIDALFDQLVLITAINVNGDINAPISKKWCCERISEKKTTEPKHEIKPGCVRKIPPQNKIT